MKCCLELAAHWIRVRLARVILPICAVSAFIIFAITDFWTLYSGRFDVSGDAEYIHLRTTSRSQSAFRIDGGAILFRNTTISREAECFFGSVKLFPEQNVEILRLPDGSARIRVNASSDSARSAYLVKFSDDGEQATEEISGSFDIIINSKRNIFDSKGDGKCVSGGDFNFLFEGIASIGRKMPQLDGEGNFNPGRIAEITIKESATRHISWINTTDLEIFQKSYGPSYIITLGNSQSNEGVWAGFITAKQEIGRNNLLTFSAYSFTSKNASPTVEISRRSDENSRIIFIGGESNKYLFSDSGVLKLIFILAIIWEFMKDWENFINGALRLLNVTWRKK